MVQVWSLMECTVWVGGADVLEMHHDPGETFAGLSLVLFCPWCPVEYLF